MTTKNDFVIIISSGYPALYITNLFPVLIGNLDFGYYRANREENPDSNTVDILLSNSVPVLIQLRLNPDVE